MKAARIHHYGSADELRFEECDPPRLRSQKDVIVKLKTAALNHVDIWNRLGGTGTPIAMPHILGADGSGVIVERGEEVGNIQVGDAVCLYPFTGCGDCEFCLTQQDFMCLNVRSLGGRLNGTYAEFVTLPGVNCFAIPSYMTFDEAAAFPLVFVTLWRMLITNGGLKSGETLLIIGIGGGVASAALQLAHRIGARVIVTSGSDEKLARAEALGAAHGINHRKFDYDKKVLQLTDGKGVDIALDCIAGEVWQKSLASLCHGGRLVTCGATAGAAPNDDIDAIVKKELKIYGSTLGTREEMRQVLNFLEVSQIHPIIDRKFPLREAAGAHKYLESAQQFGKVLLATDE